MVLEFTDLKKAIDYMEKHSDKAQVNITMLTYGTVKDALLIEFYTPAKDRVLITLAADEQAFDTITKTERF